MNTMPSVAWSHNLPPRPWSTELDKFLALALASYLVGVDDLQAALDKFRHETPAGFENDRAELTAFCEHLVASNVLTCWQCEKLWKGAYKGFFLDSFKLLNHEGNRDDWSCYAAEEVHTKRRVVLRVASPRLIPLNHGQPHYEVDEA